MKTSKAAIAVAMAGTLAVSATAMLVMLLLFRRRHFFLIPMPPLAFHSLHRLLCLLLERFANATQSFFFGRFQCRQFLLGCHRLFALIVQFGRQDANAVLLRRQRPTACQAHMRFNGLADRGWDRW